MANEYFQPGSVPAPNSPGSSAIMRNEFGSVAAAFDKLPIMSGNPNEIVMVNGNGTALVTSGTALDDYVTKDGVFTLTNKTIAWADNTFPGFGTGATKNAGSAAGEVPVLAGASLLPVLDGSLLTNLNVNQAGSIVDIAHGGTGANTYAGAQAELGINLKADANNAVLTGAPTAPHPPTGDDSARIATTFFVQETVTAIGGFGPGNAVPQMNGVASPGVSTLGARTDHVHPTDTSRAPTSAATAAGTSFAPAGGIAAADVQAALVELASEKANLVSPMFSGDPTAPTPTAGDNDTSIATTAFVQSAIAPLAPLASPVFTGDPRAPTTATSDNDTSIATTAFVQSLLAQQPPGVQVSNSTPLINGVAAPGTGVEASRYDHVHPTDTSRVDKAGDTMTGTLAIKSNASKNRIDITGFGDSSAAATFSPVMNNVPIANQRLIAGSLGGDWLFEGCPRSNASPTVSQHLTPKGYVDAAVATRAAASAETATGTSFTPAGNIAATNVQAAIAELDTETQAAIAELDTETQAGLATKVSKSGDTMTGVLAAPEIKAANGATYGLVVLSPQTSSPNQSNINFFSDNTGYALDINCGTIANNGTGRRPMRIYDGGQVRIGDPSGQYGQSSIKDVGFFCNKPTGSTATQNISAVQCNDSMLSLRPWYNPGIDYGNEILSIQVATMNALLKLNIASGALTHNGNLITTAAGNTSDRRTKENIEPLVGSLEKLLQVVPVSFTFKPEFQYGDKTQAGTQFGVIADEIAQVLPELVHTSAIYAGDVGKDDADPIKSVNYTGLIPLLVEAVKELKAEVDDLRAQLASHP